jgi:hypothetical protein
MGAHVTTDNFKKELRKKFPTLKKPFLGRDVIECRDRGYILTLPHGVYVRAYEAAWAEIESLGIKYGENFPDCDDFADMMLGGFKKGWWKAIRAGKIPEGEPPAYSVVEGYNPQGENHNYSHFKSDAGHFIADYWNIIPAYGYRPMRMRF